jgi:hypothetical protein
MSENISFLECAKEWKSIPLGEIEMHPMVETLCARDSLPVPRMLPEGLLNSIQLASLAAIFPLELVPKGDGFGFFCVGSPTLYLTLERDEPSSSELIVRILPELSHIQICHRILMYLQVAPIIFGPSKDQLPALIRGWISRKHDSILVPRASLTKHVGIDSRTLRKKIHGKK